MKCEILWVFGYLLTKDVGTFSLYDLPVDVLLKINWLISRLRDRADCFVVEKRADQVVREQVSAKDDFRLSIVHIY